MIVNMLLFGYCSGLGKWTRFVERGKSAWKLWERGLNWSFFSFRVETVVLPFVQLGSDDRGDTDPIGCWTACRSGIKISLLEVWVDLGWAVCVNFAGNAKFLRSIAFRKLGWSGGGLEFELCRSFSSEVYVSMGSSVLKIYSADH